MREPKKSVAIRLTRDAVLGINKYKTLLFGTDDVPVSSGYIVTKAFEEIFDDYQRIDWFRVNSKSTNIPGITDDTSNITGIDTRLSLDKSMYEEMKLVQNFFIDHVYEGRVYFSFVVTSVLKAAIIHRTSDIKKYYH